jgi:hypothetical protein
LFEASSAREDAIDFPGCFGRDALFLAVLRMPPPMASGCALWTHRRIGRDRPEYAKKA